MKISVCLFCVGSGFSTGWSPDKEGLLTVYMITKLKEMTKAQYRAAEPLMHE
jgi:hypothetical protein